MFLDLINPTLFPKGMEEVFALTGLSPILSYVIHLALDGTFSLPCVLFGDRYPVILKATGIKNLFSEPFKHWNDASCCFNNHTGIKKSSSKLCLHDSTSAVFTLVLSQLSGKTQPIDIMISENRREKIAENRGKAGSHCGYHYNLWSSMFIF